MSDAPNPFASPQTAAVDVPATEWAADNPVALRKVKLGLLLVYIGICGLLIAGLAFPGLVMLGGPEVPATTAILLGLVFIGLAILMFVGQLFCIAAPRESGAKPLILTAVVLQGVAFLASLAIFALPAGGTAVTAISVIGNVFSVVSLVCFILFLRKFAIYIQRPDIAGRATRALIVGLLSTVLLVALIAAATLTSAVSLGLLILPCMIGMLIGLVMYANTVTYLRKAIVV